MAYQTVYDLTNTYHFNIPASIFSFYGLCIAAMGLVLFFINKRWPKKFKPSFTKSPKVFYSVFVGVGLFLSLFNVLVVYKSSRHVDEKYLNEKCELVEGEVRNFVPMPYGGHALESFEVNHHLFSYSDYEITGAYNNTSTHGGPIREGLKVRIHCLGNKILKLEISK